MSFMFFFLALVSSEVPAYAYEHVLFRGPDLIQTWVLRVLWRHWNLFHCLLVSCLSHLSVFSWGAWVLLFFYVYILCVLCCYECILGFILVSLGLIYVLRVPACLGAPYVPVALVSSRGLVGKAAGGGQEGRWCLGWRKMSDWGVMSPRAAERKKSW